MSVVLLQPGMAPPDPTQAGPEGLVAVGGDLRPEALLSAYARGVFPWYERPPILWFSPDPRMVLRPAELRLSRRLRRTLRQGRFEVRLDTAFEEVIRGCAAAPRPRQGGTWITPDMIRAYVRLHRLGYAHSAEAWRDGVLAGGLYGVSLGAVFYGESMFTRVDDASKVALATLVRQLQAWDFALFDCQVHTDHSARFGATEWPRRRFLQALAAALQAPTRRGNWSIDPAPPAW
jgi:leucyl/phenylalanyl-tRNA---protein transferase